MRRTSLLAALCAGTLAATLAAAPSSAHGDHGGRHRDRGPETIASGLVGPLTLAVHDSSSRIYVTQSFAGLLSKIDRRGNVTDLVANPNPDGEVVGVSLGRGGVYYVDTDYAAGTSHVNRVDRHGHVSRVSRDLFAYEAKHNPDQNQTYGFVGLSTSCAADLAQFEQDNAGMLPPLSEYTGIVESHGYQTKVDGRRIYVADAAANAVLRVDARTGKIRTVAVLPPLEVTFTPEVLGIVEGGTGMDVPDCLAGSTFMAEPVPTDVAVGKDGRLYVSTLQGWLGEMLPLSVVYRVDPHSGRVRWVAGEMHGATGLDVKGRDIVVAEMFAGEVSVIKKGRHTAKTLFTVPSPGDVDVHGRYVYATAGVFDETGNGSVVRYRMR
jgi:DNA-binding beta-propeller fold protein YncE